MRLIRGSGIFFQQFIKSCLSLISIKVGALAVIMYVYGTIVSKHVEFIMSELTMRIYCLT